MGFFEKVLGKKEEKARSYGVCIPLHKKEKKAEEEKPVKAELPSTAFEVDGYYQSKNQAMVRGTVKTGSVTAKKKAVVLGKEFRIAEVQKDQKKVKVLEEGECGAIFLRGKSFPIQGGQTIEIK